MMTFCSGKSFLAAAAVVAGSALSGCAGDEPAGVIPSATGQAGAAETAGASGVAPGVTGIGGMLAVAPTRPRVSRRWKPLAQAGALRRSLVRRPCRGRRGWLPRGAAATTAGTNAITVSTVTRRIRPTKP